MSQKNIHINCNFPDKKSRNFKIRFKEHEKTHLNHPEKDTVARNFIEEHNMFVSYSGRE